VVVGSFLLPSLDWNGKVKKKYTSGHIDSPTKSIQTEMVFCESSQTKTQFPILVLNRFKSSQPTPPVDSNNLGLVCLLTLESSGPNVLRIES